MSNESDLESGKNVVKKEDYNIVVGQATEIGQEFRDLKRKSNSTNRKLDAMRRIIQTTVGVIIVLLIISLFVDHPALNSHHRYPAVASMAAICIGYAIALELTKGNPGIILFLICSGIGVSCFTLGLVLGTIKRNL